MTFRWSATDLSATDIGPSYDIGLATRDGSKLACLDRNLHPVSVDRMAYMLSRFVRSGNIRWASSFSQAFKESTELQEKSQRVQLGTSTAIDREFDQWVQNTQGDWSGGIGQRVYGQQGLTNQFFDGEGLLWPLNDWAPQLGLRGPTQALPAPGVSGPAGADTGTEVVTPGGALTVKQIASVLLSLKANGVPVLVGALGAFTTGTNTAVAPPFGQATTAARTLIAAVDGQRQTLGGSGNLGETGAATSSFNFSGANTDNEVATDATFVVPAGGIYVNSISCYMGGHNAAVNTRFAIWNATTHALIVASSTFSAGKGRSLKTKAITQTFIAAGTVIRIGFWRQQSQDAEWGVAASGTFRYHSNTGSLLEPTTVCVPAYICGKIQAYISYQQLTTSDIVQSNAGAAPGWTKRIEKNSPDGQQQVQWWVKDNCGAGETAPAFAAAAGASPMHARLMEWNNIALASSTDQSGSANNSNLASLTVTNGAQDSIAGDLVLLASRVSLSGSGTAAFTESFNNGATAVDFGDSGGGAATHHGTYSYALVPTGVANWASWANTGIAGGYVEGLGHGYALCYLDDAGTPHWHASFFSGDSSYDVDLGADTGSKQGPLHMHIAGGYLWILFSEYPNANQLSVRMLGCLYGTNSFAQLRNDAITPTTAGSSGFSGLIAASEVGGKMYVAFLQADANQPPGAPSANRNALYVLDYSAGTGVAPSGIAAPAFQFPFLRGFKLVDLCWQGNQLIVSAGDGLNAYIYELASPFSAITSRSVIPGIANALICTVGSTVFINGWTPGPAGVGINRMDLYTLDSGTLTEIPFSPVVPFVDSVTSPQAFGGYAMWAVGYPTPGAADPNQKTITVYAYDVVRSRLFRALTFTDPTWTSSDVFGHDEIALYGVTVRTQAAGATFQSQLGMAMFSGVISSGAVPESAREFYWGVRPITPTPSFTGLLQMGVNIVSGLFDFTAATNKLFRAVLAHFIDGLQAGASSPSVTLNVWFDQDPNRLSSIPDFTLGTGTAPNPLPEQLDLTLFANQVARKLVYQVITENGAGYNGSDGWQNAPKITDVIVQAATGWVYDVVFDISPGVVTNSGAPQDYAYPKQSDPASNDEIDGVVAYNFLKKLWREKGGECTIYLPNGESFPALIQLLEFESPKPAATVSRSDKQTEYQVLAAAKIREDI